MSGVEHKVYARDPRQDAPDCRPETWWRDAEGKTLIWCKHANACMVSGHRADPRKNWTIGGDGTVSPSVYWKGTCECHIFVRLEGWPG